MAPSSNRSNIVAGAVAGALAGFAASWAMNFSARIYACLTTPRFDPADPEESHELRLRRRKLFCIERADPTGEGAERLAERFLHRRLTGPELEFARDFTHYAFGTAAGAAYGAFAESNAGITRGFGLLFAAMLLVGGEEIATPALGLLDPPWKLPLDAHIAMTASHIVYGLSLEATRRVARSAFAQTPWPKLAKSA